MTATYLYVKLAYKIRLVQNLSKSGSTDLYMVLYANLYGTRCYIQSQRIIRPRAERESSHDAANSGPSHLLDLI
jgi:hypothetical protein